MRKRFYCQPCDHRWWQHRHPDKRVRMAGAALMACGVLNLMLALRLFL